MHMDWTSDLVWHETNSMEFGMVYLQWIESSCRNLISDLIWRVHQFGNGIETSVNLSNSAMNWSLTPTQLNSSTNHQWNDVWNLCGWEWEWNDIWNLCWWKWDGVEIFPPKCVGPPEDSLMIPMERVPDDPNGEGPRPQMLEFWILHFQDEYWLFDSTVWLFGHLTLCAESVIWLLTLAFETFCGDAVVSWSTHTWVSRWIHVQTVRKLVEMADWSGAPGRASDVLGLDFLVWCLR